MARGPHLPTYIAGVSFLVTVFFLLAFILASTGTAGAIIGAVIFIVLCSTVYVVSTNLLIQDWIEDFRE